MIIMIYYDLILTNHNHLKKSAFSLT